MTYIEYLGNGDSHDTDFIVTYIYISYRERAGPGEEMTDGDLTNAYRGGCQKDEATLFSDAQQQAQTETREVSLEQEEKLPYFGSGKSTGMGCPERLRSPLLWR